MILLKQDITRKEQVNELLELESELNVEEDIKYKIKTAQDSIVYVTKTIGHLPR